MSKNQDEADGQRREVTYDGDPLYIFVSEESREIFISSVQEKSDKVGAIYDSLTRMISTAWQHETKEAVIEQLKRSSRSKKDLPGILAMVMAGER